MSHIVGIRLENFGGIHAFEAGKLLGNENKQISDFLETNGHGEFSDFLLVNGHREYIEALKVFFAFLHDFLLTDAASAIEIWKQYALPIPVGESISAKICVRLDGKKELVQYELLLRESVTTGRLAKSETIYQQEEEEYTHRVLKIERGLLRLNQNGNGWQEPTPDYEGDEYTSILANGKADAYAPDIMPALREFLFSYFPFDFHPREWSNSMYFGEQTPLLTRDGRNLACVAMYWRLVATTTGDHRDFWAENYFVSSRIVPNIGARELVFSSTLDGRAKSISDVPLFSVKLFAYRLLIRHANLYGNIFLYHPENGLSEEQKSKLLLKLLILYRSMKGEGATLPQVWVFTSFAPKGSPEWDHNSVLTMRKE